MRWIALARRSALGLGLGLVCGLVFGLVACGDDGAGGATSGATGGGSEGENPEPHVRVEGPVDLLDLCGTIGSTNVFLRATRVGCVGSPPAPCTIPTNPYEIVVGDTAGCPSALTGARMEVEIEATGKYQIEAVTITESGHQALCYGSNGASVIEVTQAELDGRATIAVDPLAGPCPAP
ncbi:MAG: hypothetical protein H6711_16330 [Myxococcales bacterium]|nr:hypothetical protein [Myxococcales bacterium]